MRFRPQLVGALAGLLGFGCSTVPLANDPITTFERPDFPGQGVFSVDWQLKLVGAQLWEFFPREFASPAVDADTGRIFTATRDGKVRGVNANGTVAWEFETPGAFAAGPSVHEGSVYVPGGDGTLYALKVSDGTLLWKYAAGERLATPPVVRDGRVFVASEASTLFAVDAASGNWLWQYRRDTPAGFMIRGASTPTVTMGTLYIGFADGAVVALDPESGAEKWVRELSQGKEFLDIDTTPIVDDAGRVFVASYKDGVFALEGDSGETLWTTQIPGIIGMLGRGEVVFTSGDQGVGAVLAEDGRVLWRLPVDRSAAQPPAFARGMLIAPINDALLFVDPSSGRRRLAWDPGNGVTATPVWANQRLYVLSNNGYLYALRFENRG